MMGDSRARDRVRPELFFVGSAVFHYLGPAFAVLLFSRLNVLGVTWLRIASAAAVFAIWRWPVSTITRLDGEGRRLVIALGTVLAAMNLCFYEAISRLPLGTVAAIEFLGPVTMAATGARNLRNLVAVALASAGVYLLTEVRLDGERIGFMFAFANALLFVAYIVLAHRLAQLRRSSTSVELLGASMLVATIVVTPVALGGALPAFSNPITLGAGVGVGVTSSVIPYVFDQLAMARLRRATYALFVAILPATAVLIGVVVLRQFPQLVELTGVALVIGGVLTHRTRGHRSSDREWSGAD